MNECEHEHDDEENGFYMVEPPAWKFSLWDVAGITLHTTSGILGALAHGSMLLSQECQASANRARRTWDIRQAERKAAEQREAMAADLRALVEGGETS